MNNNVGFHNDIYLLSLVDALVENGKIANFIETGTYEGTTLSYFSTKYPNISCMSCEPDKLRYNIANKKTANNKNVNLFNSLSQELINVIGTQHKYMFDEPTLFWLDAHGYGFEWPLLEEISFITNNFRQCYVLIDDFVVPKKPIFGYDSYDGQQCSNEYIKNSIVWNKSEYKLFYPSYTEHTSPIHPLRGWGLYAHGMPLDFLNNCTRIE